MSKAQRIELWLRSPSKCSRLRACTTWGFKEALAAQSASRQVVLKQAAQIFPEPASHGDAEPRFSSVEQTPGQVGREGLLEQVLLAVALDLESAWHLCHEFDKRVIQERGPAIPENGPCWYGRRR